MPTKKRPVADDEDHDHENDTIKLGAVVVHPGEQVRVEIALAQMATQGSLGMPVEVIFGEEPGPRLLVCGAVHGDEINGIEIIRQLLPLLSPMTLRGALIAVPIINVPGFLAQSRYLPDRRDLNRSFPGSRSGSQASRIAFTFMENIVKQSTHVIDIHTAAQHRQNMPQIRANLNDEDCLRLAEAFGAPVIVHSAERDGSLRMAAGSEGLPTIVYEAGEACRFDPGAIETGLVGVLGVMHQLGMVSAEDIHFKKLSAKSKAETLTYAASKWIRASRGGLFRSHVRPGDVVHKDQFLGFIADAFGEGMSTLRAPKAGIVIGLHCNPVVHHGDALVHLAIDKRR